MNRRDFVKRTTIASLGASFSHKAVNFIPAENNATRKIFVTGGGYDAITIKYLIPLTGKENPKYAFCQHP